MDCTNKDVTAKRKFSVIFGDSTLGIHGCFPGQEEGEFHYIFSYVRGGLESLAVNGTEWLYRAPRPCFWRATTDNDKGNQFPIKSGMWLAADQFIKCIGTEVKVDGEEIPFPPAPFNNRYTGKETAVSAEISFLYETITIPAAKVRVTHIVNGEGQIRIKVHYYGVPGLPQLPVFGMRFLMPSCAERFVYEGLSGETYPDRKAGGVPGIYEVEGLPVTPYLVPQDCGMHMDTRWVEIDRRKARLRICMDQKEFAFSCLPYTAEELENATHQEELPPARRTVLCVYGAVRGVGGRDSWGADVEEAYHIDAQKDIEYSFVIEPK